MADLFDLLQLDLHRSEDGQTFEGTGSIPIPIPIPAVAVMVDRLVHHSHVLVLKGDSYRLKDKQQEVIATIETT